MQITAAAFTGFDDYMNRLTPQNNFRNNWFRDYWQESFHCRVPDADAGVGGGKRKYLSGPGGGMSPLDNGTRRGHGKSGNTRHAFAKTCDPRLR